MPKRIKKIINLNKKAKHKTQNDNGIEIVKQKKTKKV